MDKNKALEILRSQFLKENKVLIEKIEKYEKKETVHFSVISDYGYDYMKCIEIRKKGFISEPLSDLFEILMLIHFFNSIFSMELNVRDYILLDIFDDAKFKRDAQIKSEIALALNVVHNCAVELMQSFGAKNPNSLLKKSDTIMSLLKSIEHAMRKEIFHFGSHEFLASVLPIDDDCVVQNDLGIINQVFYTYKPEHIITMAMVSKPGIYIIANVPYGRYAETAFYVLFRFQKGACLIENSKHSFRRQHYRDKSYGQDGRDAWLERRYETTYFPVDTVLDYFNGMSIDKDLSVQNKDHSFRSLGEITKVDEILWLHAFKDKCLQSLSEEGFVEKLSVAMSIEYILPELENAPDSIPAIYKKHIPSFSDFDLTWNAHGVEVKESVNNYLEPYIRNVKVGLSQVPTGQLAPQAHIEKILQYQQREQNVKDLQESLKKDFIDNWEQVFNSIVDFIYNFGHKKTIQRALENNRYPLKLYAQFGQSGNSDTNSQILYSDYFSPEDPYVQRYVGFSDLKTIDLIDTDALKKEQCVMCGKFRGKHLHIVQFLDYSQFKTFFRVTKQEEKHLPYQLKHFLNQERTLYYGNSILSDVDPLCHIENPWWTHGLRDYAETLREITRIPSFFLKFRLCKRCVKKFSAVSKGKNVKYNLE